MQVNDEFTHAKKFTGSFTITKKKKKGNRKQFCFSFCLLILIKGCLHIPPLRFKILQVNYKVCKPLQIPPLLQ